MFNKKLIAAAVLATIGSVAAVAPTQAGPMSVVAGSVTIYFDKLLDQGTIGYTNPSQAFGTTQTLCTTIAECDNPLLGQTPTTNGFGSDTWGIFSVSRILSNVTGDDLWTRQVTTSFGVGTYLTGLFYGLQDFRVDYTVSATGNQSITTYSTGGQVDLYWNASEYNTATLLSNAHTAPGTFTGITDTGVKAATLAFNPTADAVVSNSAYRSMYNYTSNGSGGVGYLDVVSGSGIASANDGNLNTTDLASLLERSDGTHDPLTQDPEGVYHDVALYTVFGKATDSQLNHGWTVKGDGHADTAIPEPTTLALLGLGLFGLASMRRRA